MFVVICENHRDGECHVVGPFDTEAQASAWLKADWTEKQAEWQLEPNEFDAPLYAHLASGDELVYQWSVDEIQPPHKEK